MGFKPIFYILLRRFATGSSLAMRLKCSSATARGFEGLGFSGSGL